MPASSTLNITKKALTVEVWIKPSRTSIIYGTIMVKGNGTFRFRHRHTSSGDTLLFIMYDPVSGRCYFNPNYPYKTGWRHLVITYNGSKIKGFADGKEIVSTLSCSQSFRDNLSESLVVGNTNPADQYAPFYGLIDNIRIYEEALSSTQIKKLYVEGAEKKGLLVEE